MTQHDDKYALIGNHDDDNILSEFDSDLARLNREAEAILNSIRHENAAESLLRPCSPSVTSDDDDEDACNSKEDDMHDDDEMNDEILRLGSVVASLQQDLDNVANTVTDEFESPVASEPPNECKSAMDRNDRFTDWVTPSQRTCESTMGGEKMNAPLILANLLVW
eukprot:CAMPEP_0202480882 /NCGR_PEP_ID=MMETSP1361-20130828/699_1 /ASSEMBLY_ACC=CAM_ASM_000849 /TAXON_ID=210615 /ORGANISM="Staurosira complex sp., Strain CCMP2646" /LENGTH=164 /DNA_ID=CAMNT_0049108355 /DNA_START=166 /DNA_END=657 /DNA_ORIENTATION=-